MRHLHVWSVPVVVGAIFAHSLVVVNMFDFVYLLKQNQAKTHEILSYWMDWIGWTDRTDRSNQTEWMIRTDWTDRTDWTFRTGTTNWMDRAGWTDRTGRAGWTGLY